MSTEGITRATQLAKFVARGEFIHPHLFYDRRFSLVRNIKVLVLQELNIPNIAL
tara:strand:- start:341 stop:502 length:162 start_codon:yes stop_codon:yes gene_type:complete